MCIDFTYLNKACPKDSYPLSMIDKLVDSTSGHANVKLYGCFLKYPEIPLYFED